jgi:ABC-type nitrate/sulfonate/bicarbonate transport system ATPase subunit
MFSSIYNRLVRPFFNGFNKKKTNSEIDIEENIIANKRYDSPITKINTYKLEELMYGVISSNNIVVNNYTKLGTEDVEDFEDFEGVADFEDFEYIEDFEKDVHNEKNDDNEDDDIEFNKKPNHTKNLELLKLSWLLLPNKFTFIFFIVVLELIKSFSTIGLLLENKLIVISAPLLVSVLSLIDGIYNIDIFYKIKHSWLHINLDYFNDLSWIKKNEQEDMTDFHRMINSSSTTLSNLITWGLPTIVSGITNLTTVMYVLIIKGYWKIIFITSIIYYIYFKFIMKSLQEKLATMRSKMKDSEKIIVSKRKWLLQLFKNNKRKTDDVINLELELDTLENEFIKGWNIITNGMSLVSCLISFIGLYGIDNWENLLLVKIIFDDLRHTIETFSHFSNNLTARSKDFDKYLSWYEGTCGREKKIEYYSVPENGLSFNTININFDNKFILDTKDLSIKPNDVIILRGPTGIGKTQLINSLQGLISGSDLKNGNGDIEEARNYQLDWEYLDQNMRETIPNYGLSLREMLFNEPDTELIFKLVQVVKLDDKIKNKKDIDVMMKGFSGGQRMKTSLIFTLLEVIKQNKSILVLDEPEQGLDPYSRLEVVRNVLEFCKSGIKKYINKELAILVIYHGDDTDIIKLHKLSNKIWLLKKNNGKTIVDEITNIKKFCNELLDIKKNELKSLYTELK